MSESITNIDDELEDTLDQDPIFRHILKYAPQSQRDLMQFEIARYFTNKIKEAELRGEIKGLKSIRKTDHIELLPTVRPMVWGEDRWEKGDRMAVIPRMYVDDRITQLTNQHKGE